MGHLEKKKRARGKLPERVGFKKGLEENSGKGKKEVHKAQVAKGRRILGP